MSKLISPRRDSTSTSHVNLFAVADGQLSDLTLVNDLVFAQKMIGEGYVVLPTNGQIATPVEGLITNVFPTHHAIGMNVNGLEILIHMGVDTVNLNGEGFQVFVEEGEEVKAGQVVAEMDLAFLQAREKDTDVIVVFTNGSDFIESIEYYDLDQVEKGQKIAVIHCK